MGLCGNDCMCQMESVFWNHVLDSGSGGGGSGRGHHYMSNFLNRRCQHIYLYMIF